MLSKEDLKEAVLTVIRQRKSVRSFIHDRIIPKEEIVALIRAGMAAPTARNSQPWEFIAINEKEVIKKVAATSPFAEMLNDAGNAIILAASPNRFDKNTPDFWVQDLSAATENILLAAEAMGLGAVWCGVYPVEDRMQKLREALNIPEQIIPFNIICVGYPTGYDEPIDKWNFNRIHINTW